MGQLTAGNAADLLLNEVYLSIDDPQEQDDFFASAAQSSFQAVTDGRGDPKAVVAGLTRGVAEGRILVWSDNREEQRLLSSTRTAGALADDDDDSPDVGVYLNDGTGAKLGYYLDYDVRVQSFTCDDNGVQRLRVTTTMASTAPADAKTSLPVSVLGSGVAGVPPGITSTNVMLYAPAGGSVQRLTLDGKRSDFFRAVHDRRPVAGVTLYLDPGQKRELVYDLVTGKAQAGDVNLRVTPGVPGSGNVDGGPERVLLMAPPRATSPRSAHLVRSGCIAP